MNALAQKLQKYLKQSPLQSAKDCNDSNIKGEELMAQVRAVTPSKCSNRIRIQCAQFIVMHWTTEAMQLGKQSQEGKIKMPDWEVLEQFKAKQTKDFTFAWELLSAGPFHSPELKKAAEIMKIDIAQRLEDPVKLSKTFKEFTRKRLNPQDILIAITTAPFLADWKTAKSLIRKAERFMGRQMLDTQWHSMSQNMPIPDYSMLFGMADAHGLAERPTPNPKDLTWATIRIAKIRVKFAHVDCGPFKDKAAALLKEITRATIQWDEVPGGSNIHIKKMGGFFQTVSFGEIPMSLCGPYLEDGKLHVIGTVELILEDASQQNDMKVQSKIDTSKVVLKREEWILERVQDCLPPVWKGTYIINQVPVKLDYNNPDTAPVNMAFEVEFYEKGPDGRCCPLIEEKGEEKVPIRIDDEKDEIVILKPAPKGSKLGCEDAVTLNTLPKDEKPKVIAEIVVTDLDDLEMD